MEGQYFLLLRLHFPAKLREGQYPLRKLLLGFQIGLRIATAIRIVHLVELSHMQASTEAGAHLLRDSVFSRSACPLRKRSMVDFRAW